MHYTWLLQAVQPHLQKCFDAIKKLQFGRTEEGKVTTDILAMISPEGENVTLGKGIKGTVLIWLENKLN